MSDLRTDAQYFFVAMLAAATWGCSVTAPPAQLSVVSQDVVVKDAISRSAEPTFSANSTFYVDFTGIILHVANPPNKPTFRRAVVAEASMFKPHQPILAVIAPTDPAKLSNLKAKLNAATGHVVRCNPNQCRVKIGGFAMRIRSGKNKPLPRLDIDESFKCLLPRMRDDPAIDARVVRSEILRPSSDTQVIVPSGPALGYFEIENGRLEATPFVDEGYFQTALDECLKPPYEIGPDECKRHSPDLKKCAERVCRQFADVVTWSGVTDGPAVLEIGSYETVWKWVVIPIANEGPLMISVENLSSSGHPSSEHFALNEKLLVNKTLPVIHPCYKPCKECKPPGSINAVNVVPGCSDNQWP